MRDGDSIFLLADNRFTTRRIGRSLLPSCQKFRDDDDVNACGGPCEARANNCQVAGDQRVNEQPGLTTLHTIFLREHNRVATALERLNQQLSQERIFQEARRIVNAEWQHIIYNEFVPIVVGRKFARSFDLLPLSSGFTSGLG